MSDHARPVPVVDDDTYEFFHGGKDGELHIAACAECDRLFHPPSPICPNCFSRSIDDRPVSGRGHVISFTVVRRAWVPGYEPPYVVARVVLEEQPDLHLLTNVVGCDVDAVRSGMAVEVVFEQREDVFVPMFQPVT